MVPFVKKVGTMLDSMSVKGVDRRYIDAPKNPWQLIVKGNVSQTLVSMNAHGYATNVPEMMKDPTFWDTDTTNEEWDEWFYSQVHITHMADKTFNSGVSLGFDARMSLTYNVGNVFFNAYGQFNNIRYHHNNTNGYLNDWFINTSIGIRL